jgi:streptogramin lyase
MIRRLAALGLIAALAAPPAAVSAAGVLFVANKAEGSVSRIRLADGREEKRGSACNTPHELALSPDGRHLAVGCYDGMSIAILRSDDLEQFATVELGANARPHGIVWHANGDLFASAEGRKSIFRISDPTGTAPKIAEFPTGKDVSHMVVVAPDARTAWTADLGSGSVTRIDLAGERRRNRSRPAGAPKASRSARTVNRFGLARARKTR